jgi:hypothetical protein
MSEKTNPEKEPHSDGKLNPDYYSRLYPSKWDLSELCKPRQGRKPPHQKTDELVFRKDAKPADENLT